ncbi:hypothetical protein QVD17_38739 [Tagetes erecta]|uniref:Uncharacterized protein n=2 Tax=Magnoliopsida TaxID=3398 RepID=A0AAD8JPF6_TARER|nr:hypothetical protein QVD17_38739 [Tagetes erecta]
MDTVSSFTGDTPPPRVTNSIAQLRRFSTALSTFINRYDALQTQIALVKSDIESKLPNQLVDVAEVNANPKQSPVTRLLETVCVQTITANPSEQSHAIATTRNFEATGDLYKSQVVDASKSYNKDGEEIDVLTKQAEQNPNRMAGKCEIGTLGTVCDQMVTSEEIGTWKKIEVVNVLKHSEEIDTLKKCDVLKTKHVEVDASNTTGETIPETCCDQIITHVVSEQNPGNCEPSQEYLRTPEQTDMCKNSEEICTLTVREETDTSNNSLISVLESLCRSMNYKEMKRHVAKHISEMIYLREEIAKALKLAEDPAKLVLDSIGKCHKKGSKGSRYAGKMASVLILECFAMISSDGIEIAKQDQRYAAAKAVLWRIHLIREGGLSHADEVDARGLLLLISGFGIPDYVFKIQDIVDLIRASNVKGIFPAICRSGFLISKIPEVIDFMVKNDLEVEAVDLAYAFGLEDMCHTRNILTTYLQKRLKFIQNGSSVQMLEAMKQQLFDLKSVKQCLESHNIDLSMLLPEFEVNEGIQNLEKEVNEGKLIQKGKFSENPNPQESKHACFGHENKPEQTNFCKNSEEIHTLKKHEETETSKKSVISVLESLCQTMSYKEMNKHVATHISEMIDLREEIAKALKLAKEPAKLVLNSIGKGYGFHQEHEKAGRLASVLILECFLMIGIEIVKRDREPAAIVAVIWRKRMIREGGLRHAEEVDARGLLLLISGFGIQDHVFTTEDITDLIRASNVNGISIALRRSVFLIPKMPEVISYMVKNDLEIEAVDLAYTFGLEDKCHPQNILTTYLHKKLKVIQNGSSVQMAMKQQLFDLESVKQCLESHNIDLPEFQINEKIQNLENEINEGKLLQKRKSSENSIHQESKRACFGHENMPHQHKHVLKMPNVVDASSCPEEVDDCKECEETVPETSCDQTIRAVPEATISEQSHNETVADCEQIHDNVRTPASLEEIDVSMKPEEVETLKKAEETVPETSCDQTIIAAPEAIVSEENPDGTVADCEQFHEHVRAPENLEEIDTFKKSDETIPESSCDQTVTAVSEAIVSGQSPSGMVTNCEQILEEIDVLKKPKASSTSKKPKAISTSKKPKASSTSKKPKAKSTSKKPEVTETPKVSSTSKKPELTDFCKNTEEIDTLKKHEETDAKKKATETGTSKNPVISVLEFLCQSMSSKEMKRHVADHISKMIHLRHEIAKALKLAKDPAKLVLDGIGRFYVQGCKAFCNGSGIHLKHQKSGRLASVLILECFVMISSDGIEIMKSDSELAAAEAVIWKERMIREGGLRHTEEVDARGLLLFISGFGIRDNDFTIQDITDLIRGSNVKEIATALRRSVVLIPKIPEVVDLMVKNNLEVEAVDIAYTFGLEDACRPQNLLSVYLRNKVKDIQNGSSFQTLEAMKQQLCDLQSVKQCLESHNIDPSVLLPEFKFNELIRNLEKEINEWNLTQKRKSSENPIQHEQKRACFGHENIQQHQQKRADHFDINPYTRSTPPSTRQFDLNPSNIYTPNYSLPSVCSAPAIPKNIHGPVANSLPRAFHGSYNQMVHPDNAQRYGWRGEYDQYYSRHGQTYDSPNDVRPYGSHGSYDQQHYSRHGQTYDMQPYCRPQGQTYESQLYCRPQGQTYESQLYCRPQGQTFESQQSRPQGLGMLEPFPRYVDTAPAFPGRRGPSSGLYGFADMVEKELLGFRSSEGIIGIKFIVLTRLFWGFSSRFTNPKHKQQRRTITMVRLTADLIWKSPHFFNALRERELDLRGNKIPTIENLGATEDQFDTIDLSDNEIVKLENFPHLNRLGTLLLNNNRITRINPNIGEFLPKLHSLVLTNNRLVNLVEIDPLASLPKLQYLSLLDNNITKKPNYRLYVIHKLKPLRLLDFKKVKQKERLEAAKLFASKEAEEEAKKLSVKTFVPGEVPNDEPKEEEPAKPVGPTPEQIIAIKAAIVNSQTLEEVARLEKALKSGQVPADLLTGNSSLSNATNNQNAADQATQENDGPADMEQE